MNVSATTKSYGYRKEGCVFCSIPKDHLIAENELAFVIRDKYPVTKLHTLIIPKRHVETFFEMDQIEVKACVQLINKLKLNIEDADNAVEGFNIGINNGQSAGQEICHCHIHLIPRRKGDVDDPTGGVRHVIPGK